KKKFAYAQYVYYYKEPPVWGSLIRVLPGQFSEPPKHFRGLIEGPEQFHAFFPLGTAVNQKLVRIVANEDLPKGWKFPLFKATNGIPKTKDKTWWLWDGKKSWKIGKLPLKYYHLPLEEIISWTVLKGRIEQGWTPKGEILSFLSRSAPKTARRG